MPLPVTISDDSIDIENHFYKGKWIQFNKKDNNALQPFEQFSNVLMQAGEEVRARDILVLNRPLRNNLERIIMSPVKLVYLIGRNYVRGVVSFLAIYLIGSYIFYEGYLQGYIIPSPNGKSGIHFNAWYYSFQKMIPFINSDMKEAYISNFSQDIPWYFTLYYSVFHPLFGIILISAILLSISRIRKGSSK